MQIGQRLALGISVIAILALGAVFALVLTNQETTSPAQAQEPLMDRGIHVYGEGRVTIVPDTARVLLGVQIEGEEIEDLREDANERMNEVIEGLEEAGIPERDIRTVTYDISVKRDWERPGQPITGYVLTQLVEVRITDIDAVGDIIDGALDNGANNVGHIQFEVEDREGAIRQAREQAMDEARSKAEHLADLGGVGLGTPIKIDEVSPALPPIYYEEPVMEMDEAADGIMPSRIAPGESVITVTVNVTYAIE